jgi:hypothetical protein
MRRLVPFLIALMIGAPFAACGEDPQTAAEFCAEHGGVKAETVEADGDATCQDGTEFEADGDESSKKKKKKKRR